MGVDLGLVRLPCTCTMSYYYATHRMEFFIFHHLRVLEYMQYAVLVQFRVAGVLLTKKNGKMENNTVFLPRCLP